VVDPSTLVHRFAASLSWSGIERTDIRLTQDICGSVPGGTVVAFWSTNDMKLFIQINQEIAGRFGVYRVSVVAERCGIAPMDFVSCAFETTDDADTEAKRLSPLFARTNFRDNRWRRRYLEQHPKKTPPTQEKMAWLEGTAPHRANG
jgi:hypothetical protein